jgi:hypothetical protein
MPCYLPPLKTRRVATCATSHVFLSTTLRMQTTLQAGCHLSQPLPKRRKLRRFHESQGQQLFIMPAAPPALIPLRPQGLTQKQHPIITPAAPLAQPIASAIPPALLPPRPQGSTSIKSLVQLIKDYERRVRATAQFPPQISDSCIRESISRFEDHMAAAIAATQKICSSCGSFID